MIDSIVRKERTVPWESLNAYVDGELASEDAAALVARLTVEDADLPGDEIAALSEARRVASACGR